MRVFVAILLLAIYCNPNECRDNYDCDPGCECISGVCQ